ncbi:hypothetical protein P9112_004694 [Eukaryota sp. TZLM1-RC]
MFLHSTLKAPSTVFDVISGSFTGPDLHELVVSKGTYLELYRLNNDSVSLISTYPTYCVIRSISAINPLYSDVNFVAATSDSGFLTLISLVNSAFTTLSTSSLGRPGLRRSVPGEFLSADPEGRVLFVSSIDDSKVALLLSKSSDESSHITTSISTWIPKPPSYTVVLCTACLHTGTRNPVLVSLEASLSDDGIDKHLVYFEYILGHNTVTRLHSLPVPSSSHLLVPLPLFGSSADGDNGGVLVCGDRQVILIDDRFNTSSETLPTRFNWPANQSNLIVSHSVRSLKNRIFVLLHDEAGDLFSLDFSTPFQFSVGYFTSLPQSNCQSLLIGGLLFLTSLSGEAQLYRITSPPTPDNPLITQDPFVPRHDRMELRQSISNTSPITCSDCLFDGRIVLNSGTSPSPSLSFYSSGLPTKQFAASPLPPTATPDGIWAVKKNLEDLQDSMIIISFSSPQSTLPLSVGKKVSPVKESGLITNTSSLLVQNIGTEPLTVLQVTTEKAIVSRLSFSSDDPPHSILSSWRSSKRRDIRGVAANAYQVVIALSGGELVYLEWDSTTRTLVERASAQFAVEATCLDISQKGKSEVVLVADLEQRLSFLSLSHSKPLSIVSMIDLSHNVVSLCLAKNHLYVGLASGVVMILVDVDVQKGRFSDDLVPYPRKLSSFDDQKCHVIRQTDEEILMITENCWSVNDATPTTFNRVIMPSLSLVASFQFQHVSGEVLRSLIGITSPSQSKSPQLLITQVLPANTSPFKFSNYSQHSLTTRYTPRKVFQHSLGWVVVAETDHGVLPVEERPEVKGREDAIFTKEEGNDMEEEGMVEPVAPRQLVKESHVDDVTFLSAWRGSADHWSSCISVVHPGQPNLSINVASAKPQLVDRWEFPEGFGIFSVTEVVMNSKNYIAVGGGVDLKFRPRRACKNGFITLFEFLNDGNLSFVHTTLLPDSCHAVKPYSGMLLAGVGRRLRLLSLGKKRLLLKSEFKILPRLVVGIDVVDERIMVYDVSQSVFFLKYRFDSNIFQLFAEDPAPRQITCGIALDYCSTALGDKFGNVFGIRLDRDVDSDVEDDPLAYKGLRDDSEYLSRAPSFGTPFFHFFLGSPISSIIKLQSVPGGLTLEDVLLVSCFDGSLHMLKPFLSRSDAISIKTVEERVREEERFAEPFGKNHLMFRSSYFPVKNVIDFDLCSKFLELPHAAKSSFCAENSLDLTEVERILQDSL